MKSIQMNNNMDENYYYEDMQQNFSPYKRININNTRKNISQMNNNFIREKEIKNDYIQSFQNIQNISNDIKQETKEETNKEKEKEEEENLIIPERSLPNYINNKFLADAILKLNNHEFYFHKIILCSCSDYINNIILNSRSDSDPIPEQEPEKKNENEKNDENNNNNNDSPDKGNRTVIYFPEIIPSSFGGGNRNMAIEKILKYCYTNQDFKSIESDINQYNVFCLLELAHSIGIKSLKLHLEKKIIKNYIEKDNVTKLIIESKIFDLPKLNKECISFIINNFKHVKIFKSDIIDLDFNTFKQIIESDDINIDNEKDISDFVISYIQSRKVLKEEQPEIEVKKENKENEEKKDEENQENPENQEKNDEKNEKNEENNEQTEKKMSEGEKWRKYLYELKDMVKRKPLTKEEEKELILCIRFNFLPHTDLVRLTNEPIMNDYKDLLLSALSLKLNSYEESINNNIDKNIFNLNPRKVQRQENYNINNNMNNDINRNNNNLYYSQNIYRSNNNNEMMNNNKPMFNSNNEFMFRNTLNNNNNNDDNYNYNDNEMNYFYKSYNFYNNRPPHFYYNKYNKKDTINNNNINKKEDYLNRNIYNDYTDIDNSNNFDNRDDEHMLNSQYFNINNKKEKEKINRYREIIKSEKKPTQNNDDSSVSYHNNQIIITSHSHIKFKYKNDFDKNGALYYIGTYGLTRKYQNPHDLKLIKVFGSSLNSGHYNDFVGRKIVDLSTENEENSFLGVDLGPNRNLIPTLYSIRNRDSSSNVLLNWCLQGSNDKINYTILDKRIFNIENGNDKYNEKYKQYRNLLKQPKTTSTWGISKKIRERYTNGFRYFLIKQIGKNSSGNYILTNSGFELYGEGIGSGWIFS